MMSSHRCVRQRCRHLDVAGTKKAGCELPHSRQVHAGSSEPGKAPKTRLRNALRRCTSFLRRHPRAWPGDDEMSALAMTVETTFHSHPPERLCRFAGHIAAG